MMFNETKDGNHDEPVYNTVLHLALSNPKINSIYLQISEV